MTITQLRCFVEVAGELNYAKAASNLYISQPAVSRHIIALENDLGVTLFVRNRHSVALTSAGSRFYSEAKDILERIDLSKKLISNSPGEEILNVGCVSSIQIHGLSRIYERYHKKMPDVIISNTEIGASDYRRVTNAEHLDIAFVPNTLKSNAPYADASLKYIPLYKGCLCCVVRKNHRLAGKESISFSDLEGETLILLDHEHCPPAMEAVQFEIRKCGDNIKYFYSGSSLYSVPMIVAGLGLAVMPVFVCPPSDDVVLRPFDMSADLEYGIVCRNNDRTEKVRVFTEITKDIHSAVQKCL
ncbi:MAG: LysR family transcriptional regulator [Oscillospiraceae bacterium]|nr:LysR family transcriptional regulator [Oscillospiraceae bacterium]